MSENTRPFKNRPPALKNFPVQPRVPGVIMPAAGVRLSNKADIVINGKKIAVEVDDLEFKSELGKGMYARVYKMLHRPSELEFAVKILPYSRETPDRSRILNDYKFTTQTENCPYTIRSYGVLAHGGEVWIIMELMDLSLDKLIQKVYRNERNIPENLVAYITFCVVSALKHLKEDCKIIHRDVKPDNILVDRLGRVKVCDFGVAGELVNSHAQTDIGTRSYYAPERIDQQQNNGKGFRIQSDVWSLGLTIYELATGRFPYAQFPNLFDQISQVVHGKPPRLPDDGGYSEALCKLVADCLVKDENERANFNTLIEHNFIRNLNPDNEAIRMAEFLEEILNLDADELNPSS